MDSTGYQCPLWISSLCSLNPSWNASVFLVLSAHPLRSRSSLSSPRNTSWTSLSHAMACIIGYYHHHLFGTTLFIDQWTGYGGPTDCSPFTAARSCKLVNKEAGARQLLHTHQAYLHFSLHPSQTVDWGACMNSHSLLKCRKDEGSSVWQGGQTQGATSGQSGGGGEDSAKPAGEKWEGQSQK